MVYNALSIVIVLDGSGWGIESRSSRGAVGAARALRTLWSTAAYSARATHDAAQTRAAVITGATATTRQANRPCVRC